MPGQKIHANQRESAVNPFFFIFIRLE